MTCRRSGPNSTHTCAIKLVETPFAQGADGIKILQTIDALDPRFLFHVLRARPLETDGYQRHFSKLREHQIPLPPLEVQKEIVAEIEDYQKVINGARAVLDHYRPQIPIRPDWPMVELGEVCSTSSGGTPLSGKAAYYEGGTIPWLRSGEVAQGEVFHSELCITEEGLKNSSAKMFPTNTVLVAMYGATAGEVGILRFEAATNQAVCGITPDEQLSSDFLYLLLKTDKAALIRLAGGGAQPNISQKIVREFKIPLPPLATQQAIVAEIEAEQALVAANRELIARFEMKIQATLARVWGESEK
jgi:type I restriction enzyme M protein